MKRTLLSPIFIAFCAAGAFAPLMFVAAWLVFLEGRTDVYSDDTLVRVIDYFRVLFWPTSTVLGEGLSWDRMRIEIAPLGFVAAIVPNVLLYAAIGSALSALTRPGGKRWVILVSTVGGIWVLMWMFGLLYLGPDTYGIVFLLVSVALAVGSSMFYHWRWDNFWIAWISATVFTAIFSFLASLFLLAYLNLPYFVAGILLGTFIVGVLVSLVRAHSEKANRAT